MSEIIGRLLAAGQRAEVFEWGTRVVKLSRSTGSKPVIFREAAIHAAVEALGLPVPSVWSVQQIDGRWGIVFDRVSGVSFAEQMRHDAAAIPRYLRILAHLHTRIHAHSANEFSCLKIWLATNIDRVIVLDDARKQILLNGLRGMPDGDRLCHGDFHPMNVLGEASQPIVIDWPNAWRGDPAADVCRSYLLLRLHADEIAKPYLDAYYRVASVRCETVLDWFAVCRRGQAGRRCPRRATSLTRTHRGAVIRAAVSSLCARDAKITGCPARGMLKNATSVYRPASASLRGAGAGFDRERVRQNGCQGRFPVTNRSAATTRATNLPTQAANGRCPQST